MSAADAKSLLLLNSSSLTNSYSLLFHCATHWAQQGSRVLFISNSPLKNLPLSLGRTDAFHNPDAFKLIQFMYLVDWKELLRQLYSIHLRHNPVSVIIVKNLENYFKSDEESRSCEEHVALVCASLLYAVSTCAKIVSRPIFLVNEYVSQDSSIEKIVVRNFFRNVWELKRNTDEEKNTFIKLSKLSVSLNVDEVVEYKFYENLAESRLHMSHVLKNIMHEL